MAYYYYHMISLAVTFAIATIICISTSVEGQNAGTVYYCVQCTNCTGNETQASCDQGPFGYCYKTVIIANNKSVTSKGCTKSCSAWYGAVTTVLCCTSDGCNEAPSINALPSAVLPLIVLVVGIVTLFL